MCVKVALISVDVIVFGTAYVEQRRSRCRVQKIGDELIPSPAKKLKIYDVIVV